MENIHGDYQRPRRPNEETIAYLRSLPLDIETSAEEVTQFLAPKENTKDAEYPQILSAALSAIDEIRSEVASLSGDEYGSQSVEMLARIAAPYSELVARTLLYACSGYHLHLATHRYGSHVVQTILELSVASEDPTKVDLAEHEDAPPLTRPNELPSLSDLILGVVQELAPHSTQLAIHICGSHVLRTLLCVIGGVELVHPLGKKMLMDTGAIRRGKAKKKKKKKKATQADSSPHEGVLHMLYRTRSRLPTENPEIASALVNLTESLSGSSVQAPGSLQSLTCHPSAGPLLIVLLRVLTYSSPSTRKIWQKKQQSSKSQDMGDYRLGILRTEPYFDLGSPAHDLVKRLLCWEPEEEDQKHAPDVIYGLAGEQRGSHLLETILRVSPDPVYASILDLGKFLSRETIQEYAEHDTSNFVIQTLMSTARTKDQAEALLKATEKVISGGLAVDPEKKRRGLLWRAVEMAAKFRVGQDTILKDIRLGFGSLEGDKNSDGQLEEKKKKKRLKSNALAIPDCVPRLLSLRMPEADFGRIGIDPAGARTIYHLLRFVPRLCKEVLQGILHGLSKEEIEHIAKDGLGSQCILDGILEGPTKDPIFGKAASDLLEKLSGRWVALSTDRVGHHTVKKLFRALDSLEDKAALAAELVNGMKRLSGNAMGRSVIDCCALRAHEEGEEAWQRALTKIKKQEAWLREMIADDDGGDGDGDGDGGSLESNEENKEKRKRPDEPKDKVSKKSKVSHSSNTVGDIMRAMTVPAEPTDNK